MLLEKLGVISKKYPKFKTALGLMKSFGRSLMQAFAEMNTNNEITFNVQPFKIMFYPFISS